MTVQCLLCSIQGCQAQTSTSSSSTAQLGVDAIDKALTGILTGCLELRFQIVEGSDCTRKSRLHCTLNGWSTVTDGGSNPLHQCRHGIVDFGGLLRYDVGQRFHHRLHTRRCEGFTI